jgi:hypothetical protein
MWERRCDDDVADSRYRYVSRISAGVRRLFRILRILDGGSMDTTYSVCWQTYSLNTPFSQAAPWFSYRQFVTLAEQPLRGGLPHDAARQVTRVFRD